MPEPIGYYGENAVEIPSAHQAPHCFMVSRTGGGKSELMKAIAFQRIYENNSALITIDPAGSMVDEMAHWKEWVGNTRLIYFHPRLERGMTPTINPFETPYTHRTDEDAVQAKQVIAQQLRDAFEQIIAGSAGSSLSLQMQALLMPCILTLLDMPGATLLDLQRFMHVPQDRREQPKNMDLVAFGQSRRHYPAVPSFFTNDFRDDARFRSTKHSISTKIQSLLNSGFFLDMTCGRSTINLEEAIENQKVILFNLGKGLIGDDESQALGRLLVALIQGIAIRRGSGTPIHLLIDECHNFISPSVRTILLEARKLKLYLTMAQQIVGDGMTPQMAKVITGSSHVLLAGPSQRMHLKDAANLVGAQPEDIGALDRGQFYMSIGSSAPLRFSVRNDLVGNSHAMTDPSWQVQKERQLESYYRPKQTAPEEPPVVDEPRHDDQPHVDEPDGDVKPGAW